MVITRLLALSVIGMLVLAVSVYAPVAIQASESTGSTITTSSCSSATMTSVVTVATTDSVTSTTSTGSSSAVSGSYSFSPASPILVQSVDAVTTRTQNGYAYVTFAATFENIGNYPIYVVGGCGSGLSSSISDSSVIRKISSGPLCACADFVMELEHGQDHTSTTPGCWSGYDYELIQPGTVTVNLTQYWSSGSSLGVNSTSIVAEFNLM